MHVFDIVRTHRTHLPYDLLAVVLARGLIRREDLQNELMNTMLDQEYQEYVILSCPSCDYIIV